MTLASIQNTLKLLDSSLRWNDANPTLFTFYDFVSVDFSILWDTVELDLPPLIAQIEKKLQKNK